MAAAALVVLVATTSAREDVDDVIESRRTASRLMATEPETQAAPVMAVTRAAREDRVEARAATRVASPDDEGDSVAHDAILSMVKQVTTEAQNRAAIKPQEVVAVEVHHQPSVVNVVVVQDHHATNPVAVATAKVTENKSAAAAAASEATNHHVKTSDHAHTDHVHHAVTALVVQSAT